MKVSCLSHYSLCLSIGIAMLAGCGGSQPPIGAPGATRQNSALAARTTSSNYKVLYSFGALPTEREHPPFGTVFAVTKSVKAMVLHRFGGGLRTAQTRTPDSPI
jgi:hypothetical protein